MPTRSITLGAELEVVKLSPQAPDLIRTRNFGMHYDRTIVGHNGEVLPTTVESGGGCELTTPVLTATVDDARDYRVKNLDKISSVITDLCLCAQDVNRSCGFHIHLGRPTPSCPSRWTYENVRTMLVVARFLEPKLFDVCPESRKGNRYCKPLDEEYSKADYCRASPVGPVVRRKYDNKKRYCWLNLVETARDGGLGTIEIRMLGNVRRPSYCMAWVELWLKLAAFVAYAEPSIVISSCCYGGLLDAELDQLHKVKTGAVRTTSAPSVVEQVEETE